MLFVRDSIDRAHDVAVSTGAWIVHVTGFDSVPSDLLAHQHAQADCAGELTETTLVVVSIKGGVSGARSTRCGVKSTPPAPARHADG